MTDRRFSQQDIQNQGADRLFGGFPMREGVAYRPQQSSSVPAQLLRQVSEDLQTYIVEDSGYYYFCKAAPGTALADPYWKITRMDSTGNVMFADANENFDNVASDPTALTYSYS